MLRYVNGFVGEGNLEDENNWPQPHSPRPEISWYKSIFFKNNHINYIAKNSPIGAVAASVKSTDNEDEYLLIIRTPDSVETLTVSSKDLPKRKGFFKFLKRNKKPEQRAIISLKPELEKTRFYECNYESVKKQLLHIESPDVFEGKYRVGLLYAKSGQFHENEIFQNNESSGDFDEFMELLGSIIELKDWDRYPGGLDITNGKTGKYSLYTEFDGNEIMWHVPILMPFFGADEQQLERKKHVGNDRAIIIFREEGGEPIPPDIISSKAIHLCIIIQPFRQDGDVYYKMSIAYKESVPFFNPQLPSPCEFIKGNEFKQFLLTKLINGIQATSHADEFKQLMGFKYKHTLNTLCSDYGVKHEKKEQPEI